MGLLKRIFRGKEEHVHFERDDSGRVTSVQRSGDVETYHTGGGDTYTRGATPVSDKLMAQSPRKPSIRSKAVDVGRRIDQGIVNYNRRQSTQPSRNRPSAKRYSTRNNYNPFGSMFDSGMNRPSAKRYSTRNNYNPFGSMFDTGMSTRKPKKKTTGARYAVVGGKAYPIAGSKKKTSKKKTRSQGYGGFDLTNNWGFFK